MKLIYQFLFFFLWLVFWLYWLGTAVRVKPVLRHEPLTRSLRHSIPTLIGTLLFFVPFFVRGLPYIPRHIVPAAFWTGTGLILAGLALSFWARSVLGTNWSGRVSVKQGHELVTRGPYRWLHHPIYAGFLLMLCGTALAYLLWPGFVGTAIIAIGFRIKAHSEERWMLETFGERYERYLGGRPHP